MATVVLGAVGSMIGGPFGGMIGSFIGQVIDQRVLAPKPKGYEGPRLSDLRIQTSHYGAEIPRLYGRMRVAGSVIWSTDLIETRTVSGGGKRTPKSTTYSYRASFAVAISSRRVRGLHRVWADGNLLRGSAGDWKSRVTCRLYDGDDDQPCDPLIESALGIGAAPAFRGIAYLLFEDMDLGDYGNRIPQMTFEIDADDAPEGIGLDALWRDLSAMPVVDAPIIRLGGYAASGGTVRGALMPLAQLAPPVRRDDGWTLGNDGAAWRDAPVLLPAVRDDANKPRHPVLMRAAEDRLPHHIRLSHYDPARDYQISSETAPVVADRLTGDVGVAPRTQDVDLAASVATPLARALCDALALRRQDARAVQTRRVGLAGLSVPLGQVMRDSQGLRWRVTARRIESDGVTLELVRVGQPRSLDAPPIVTGGTPMPVADLPGGPTQLVLVDLPRLWRDPTEPDGMMRYALAGSSAAGWRGAAISVRRDASVDAEPVGQVRVAAVIGMVESITPASTATATLFDQAGHIDVRLTTAGDQVMTDASDAAMLAGANAAKVGEEWIQFGRAQRLADAVDGSRRYRLSHLLRGRGGTETAMVTTGAGARFVLWQADRAVDLGIGSQDGSALVEAWGAMDDAIITAPVDTDPAMMRPLAPVHINAARTDDGGAILRWVRRSRAGWHWTDGLDVPIGESAEAYVVTIGTMRIDCASAEWRIDAATMATAAPDGRLRGAIQQVGSHGLSPAAAFDLMLVG